MISVGISQELLYQFDKKRWPFNTPVEASVYFKRKFGVKGLAILNELFAWTRYENIYPSQSIIATRVGCSREWVNKVLSQLIKMDLLFVVHHLHGSNDYYLSPFFYDISYRCGLAHLFPSLFPNLLFSKSIISTPRWVTNNKFEPEFTPLYINNSTSTKGMIYPQSNFVFWGNLLRSKRERKLHKSIRPCKAWKCNLKCRGNRTKKDYNDTFTQRTPLNGSGTRYG